MAKSICAYVLVVGFLTLLAAGRLAGLAEWEATARPSTPPGANDPRLRGRWRAVDDFAGYQLHVSPHVVLLFTDDERDFLEIAVDRRGVHGDEGAMAGPIVISRLEQRHASEAGRRVRLDYRCRGDDLEVEWADPILMLGDRATAPMSLVRATPADG